MDLLAQRVAYQPPRARHNERSKANDLAREAVGCIGVFGRIEADTSTTAMDIDTLLSYRILHCSVLYINATDYIDRIVRFMASSGQADQLLVDTSYSGHPVW